MCLQPKGHLSIARYVKKTKPRVPCGEDVTVAGAWNDFDAQGRDFWTGMDALLDMLDGIAQAENADA